MKLKRLSYEVSGSRMLPRFKSPPVVPTTILSALLLLLIFTDTIVSYFSMHPAKLNAKEETAPNQDREIEKQRINSILPAFPLHFEQEPGNQNSPVNRISMFRDLEISRSDNQTAAGFHDRISKFFDDKCEVRFFMTWISTSESFGTRELLAVESIFKSHSNGCLIILSRTLDSEIGGRKIKPLLDRKYRVLAVSPDFPFLLKNTPAETWFNKIKIGEKDPGKIPLAQNLSNLLRLAFLYKYGGIYTDTDFIVLKSFVGVRNSIGAQSRDVYNNWSRLNNAVLVFDRNHPLLLEFMVEFASNFNGNKWGYNGPYLVSRVVKKVEGIGGFDFSVLPPAAFYPVGWKNIGRLFRVPKDAAESRWVEEKMGEMGMKSYGVHLWNKQSKRLEIEEGSVVGRLMLQCCVLCQRVYSS